MFGFGNKSKGIDRDFDALRLRVMATAPWRTARNDAVVIMLTSRTPGEGVSTVSAGLSRAFARNGDGRVLLVNSEETRSDLSRRRPSYGGTVIDDPAKLDPETPIAEIDGWGVDGITLAPNGRRHFLYEPQWEDYFSALRTHYDVIVVDAGSLETGTPYHWANAPSQVLLVVDASRTTVQALERLREELRSANLDLTAVVLNKREFPIPQFLY